jgi:hypothetical protein
MPQNTMAHVLTVKLTGQCITEQVLNVFHYASATFSDPIGDFMSAFDAQVAAAIQTVLSVDMVLTGVEAQEVKGGSSFGSLPIIRPGPQSGDCLPPFVSFDFTLVRGGALERNGYKRVAGVPEALQANGIVTGAALTALGLVADAMFDDITTATDTWVPVIQRKRVNHLSVSPIQYWTVSSVIFSKIGSQNSRKFGHGR